MERLEKRAAHVPVQLLGLQAEVDEVDKGVLKIGGCFVNAIGSGGPGGRVKHGAQTPLVYF